MQRWVTEQPELVARDLLLITTEFDRWEIREQKVADRLDALFLDTTGAPVVAELKRDRATDTVELQALKYAAYCSQLTLGELAEEYARAKDLTVDEAHQQLVDHAPGLEDGGPRSVKIRLVAGSFGPAVTSVVLWLRDYGIDIGCIEVSARRVAGANQAVISARQLLPLPEAEDYLVRRRRKEQEEDRARDEPVEWTWESYAARFPAPQVAVARRLFDQVSDYVAEHQLPWTQALRSWYLGYQRPGGYYVPAIGLRHDRPVEFSVKLPDDPDRLKLTDPYPQLKSWWDAHNRQWTWAIPSADDVPDVTLALEMSRGFPTDDRPDAPPSRGRTQGFSQRQPDARGRCRFDDRRAATGSAVLAAVAHPGEQGPRTDADRHGLLPACRVGPCLRLFPQERRHPRQLLGEQAAPLRDYEKQR